MSPRERAILYDESMVAAILARLKRQTRRPMRPQPSTGLAPGHLLAAPGRSGMVFCRHDTNIERCDVQEDHWSPYGMPGDVLVQLASWATAREHDALKPTALMPSARIWSRWEGTPKPDWCGKLRPGRFLPGFLRDRMPRARVTEVRVERVQSISEADAMAEGISRVIFQPEDHPRCAGYMVGRDDGKTVLHPTAVGAYRELWELTYGAESWARNDWVWVVSFEPIARAA